MRSKSELRKFYTGIRDNLPTELYQQKSKSVCNKLINLLTHTINVGIYYPVKQELNILPIIELLPTKNYYLPRVPTDNNFLEFYLFKDNNQLENNQFGIPEPKADLALKSNYEDLDVIITPIVAFTNTNHRLGHGCGFYDRTLGMLQDKFKHKKIIFIGVAFSEQQAHNLPVDPWDIDMHVVVSS